MIIVYLMAELSSSFYTVGIINLYISYPKAKEFILKIIKTSTVSWANHKQRPILSYQPVSHLSALL